MTPPAFVLRIQVVEPLLEGLAVGTPDGFHAETIRTSQTRSGTADSGGTDQFELETLIKYGARSPSAGVRDYSRPIL